MSRMPRPRAHGLALMAAFLVVTPGCNLLVGWSGGEGWACESNAACPLTMRCVSQKCTGHFDAAVAVVGDAAPADVAQADATHADATGNDGAASDVTGADRTAAEAGEATDAGTDDGPALVDAQIADTHTAADAAALDVTRADSATLDATAEDHRDAAMGQDGATPVDAGVEDARVEDARVTDARVEDANVGDAAQCNIGFDCDDGNPCTSGDTCLTPGLCGGIAYDCVAPGLCETTANASCNGDGTCSYPATPGVACDDGNVCTIGDTCDANKLCAGALTCTPNATACSGAAIRTCSADGCGWSDDLCTCGCSEGACVPGCVPGSQRCDGAATHLEVCDSYGCGWATGVICSAGCSAGQTTCNECVANPCFAAPPTGQQACYDNSNLLPCAAGCEPGGLPAFCGQDPLYAKAPGSLQCYGGSCSSVAVTGEMVSDAFTGLIWQRTWAHRTWADAVSDCETLDDGGLSDWRLPNPHELRSLLRLDGTPSHINQVAFPGSPSEPFWTSAPRVALSGGDEAWFVDFQSGTVGFELKGVVQGVRCVRGGR